MSTQPNMQTEYQLRAQELAVGDMVYPVGFLPSQAGVIRALYTGIGMADVDFQGYGSRRLPVEDLSLTNSSGDLLPSDVDLTPGEGPVSKTAVYWADAGRQYRMTREELALGKPFCPKCGAETPMRRAIYKREDGRSERLYGCPSCLFLVRRSDIINFPGGE